jgi:hypothetical protein
MNQDGFRNLGRDQKLQNRRPSRALSSAHGPEAALKVHAFIAAYPSMLVTKFIGV